MGSAASQRPQRPEDTISKLCLGKSKDKMLTSVWSVGRADWGASRQAAGQSRASPQQLPDDSLHPLLSGAGKHTLALVHIIKCKR